MWDCKPCRRTVLPNYLRLEDASASPFFEVDNRFVDTTVLLLIINADTGVRRFVVCERIGKTVQIRRGPAAVTGDESRKCHCDIRHLTR